MMKSSKNKDVFERVYQIVRQIPKGKVTSYGAIAAGIGSPQAARMVGWAMNASHSAKQYVPAHRVVNRNGMLTGKHHFPSINTMQELLEAEGVKVINDKVQDFNKVFWIPELPD
jgi:methylated-DNA-protein-cysteine methyltransferase related protein